jgi:hypothetical protein
VNERWTDSIRSISFFVSGHHTADENSSTGLTKAQKARAKTEASLVLKHFKMSLALPEALATILLTCGVKLR